MQGVFLPTSQSLLVYAGLAAACGGWLLVSASRRERFVDRTLLTKRRRLSGLSQFAALALLDMEANFLLNKVRGIRDCDCRRSCAAMSHNHY